MIFYIFFESNYLFDDIEKKFMGKKNGIEISIPFFK